jgi:hypothetical protein
LLALGKPARAPAVFVLPQTAIRNYLLIHGCFLAHRKLRPTQPGVFHGRLGSRLSPFQTSKCANPYVNILLL